MNTSPNIRATALRIPNRPEICPLGHEGGVILRGPRLSLDNAPFRRQRFRCTPPNGSKGHTFSLRGRRAAQHHPAGETCRTAISNRASPSGRTSGSTAHERLYGAHDTRPATTSGRGPTAAVAARAPSRVLQPVWAATASVGRVGRQIARGHRHADQRPVRPLRLGQHRGDRAR